MVPFEFFSIMFSKTHILLILSDGNWVSSHCYQPWKYLQGSIKVPIRWIDDVSGTVSSLFPNPMIAMPLSLLANSRTLSQFPASPIQYNFRHSTQQKQKVCGETTIDRTIWNWWIKWGVHTYVSIHVRLSLKNAEAYRDAF